MQRWRVSEGLSLFREQRKRTVTGGWLSGVSYCREMHLERLAGVDGEDTCWRGAWTCAQSRGQLPQSSMPVELMSWGFPLWAVGALPKVSE